VRDGADVLSGAARTGVRKSTGPAARAVPMALASMLSAASRAAPARQTLDSVFTFHLLLLSDDGLMGRAMDLCASATLYQRRRVHKGSE